MSTPSIFAPGILKGQLAFITGGGSGLGFGIAERMAMAGADVVLASRRKELCEGKAAELREKFGVRAIGLGLNVRDPESVEAALVEATRAMDTGRLDILVNNAGANFYYPSHMLSDNQWKAILEIDLYGTFYCSRAAYPYMKDGGGLMLSISSSLQLTGWSCMLPATSAKAGIDALTRTLAVEWARHNIRVNAIAPGPVPTEGVKKAFAASGSFEGDFSSIPLGRAGTTEEVGDLAVYLASPAATWITGEIIYLDGGARLSPQRSGVDVDSLEREILARKGSAQRKVG